MEGKLAPKRDEGLLFKSLQAMLLEQSAKQNTTLLPGPARLCVKRRLPKQVRKNPRMHLIIGMPESSTYSPGRHTTISRRLV